MKTLALVIGSITALVMVGQFGWSQCPTPQPFDRASVIGTWEGVYSAEGRFLNFTLKLEEVGGDLRTSLDIPEVNARNVVYTAKVCQGQELHLKNDTGNSSIEFIGKPREGKAMSGKVFFRENGNLISEEVFTLRKLKKSL